MTITVELPPEIEARFQAQARGRGLTLDAYIQEFLSRSASTTPSRSTPELNRLLDDAADLVPGVSGLSDQAMSRDTIYTREDEW